ncbi:iron-containing alcohol dehydrogenase family protein [Pseudorhodoferax sp. Leaf267]|uniref:iron-containing alcohol dehydrogenase family protein n=1 Tax=Pseudorhodoferax sp. Leaf267 TaxID=1736316 RepID=UPI0006F86A26|nr:iron-containing alcohol dehydrogenase family protein [Pseudorhodoferax sp. Leaf267]KQP14186.1 alcohol dehydrogenase [Pseudorhodoferax sp. Leaf267]
MQTFQHIAAPLRLFHGEDALGRLGRELQRLGCTRPVVVCGGSLARQPGLLDRVLAACGPQRAGVFDQVRAHSPVPDVQAAAEAMRRLRADAVVAVGGGSAIVTARAASILLAEQQPASRLCTRTVDGRLHRPRLLAAKLPQFVVPTTPSTAAVQAGSTVFDPVRGERLALFDPKTRAQAVFADPQLLLSAPRALAISASLNTLAMAVEALVSPVGDALAHADLMQCVRLLALHLPAIARDDGPDMRSALLLAAVLCGRGAEHSASGLISVLGHAIGARHGTENGLVNAVVLPHVLRFDAQAIAPGLERLAVALALPARADPLQAVCAVLQAVLEPLGVPQRLRDLPVPQDAFAAIARMALKDWCIHDSPRPVRHAEPLVELLEQAW